MSGLCLLIDFDGGRVEERVLRAMVEASADRRPETAGIHADRGFGAAYLSLTTTSEAVGSQKPILSDDGRLYLVADARIDNRDELISLLDGDPHLRSQGASDADLILAAFRRWGNECPARVLGDFAFAVWDRLERRLFCARDPIGVRQLVYGRSGRRLAVASSPEAVLAGLRLSPTTNDELLQDFLAGRYERWIQETAYRSVARLPAAHGLTAGPERDRLARYWTPGERPAPGYRRDEEYAAHFRELFESAVRVRLRSSGPVGILVSGGLDSSSVACTAHRLAEAGEISNPVRLYSCVFERTPSADERQYLDAVLESCPRFPGVRLPSDDGWGLRDFGADGDFPLQEPEISLDRFLWQRLLRQARRDGCRVVLGGSGGDQVAAGNFYYAPGNVRDVGWQRLPRELRYFVSATGWPTWRLLAYGLLRRLAPGGLGLSRAWRAWNGDTGSLGVLREPASRRVRAPLEPLRLPSHCATVSRRSLTDGYFAAAMAAAALRVADVGIESRSPFLDRRVVDFLLALPARLQFDRGLDKLLLRRAMAGILPDKVRLRTGKVHFSDLLVRGLREHERSRVEDLLRDARIVRRGWVDPGRLSAAWVCYRTNSEAKYRYQGLANALCLEAWFRHLETGSSGSEERGEPQVGAAR